MGLTSCCVSRVDVVSVSKLVATTLDLTRAAPFLARPYSFFLLLEASCSSQTDSLSSAVAASLPVDFLITSLALDNILMAQRMQTYESFCGRFII